MSTLYELAAEYRSISEQLHEADYDEQTIADTLEGVAGSLEEKAVNIAKFVKNLESSAKARREAADEMLSRAKVEENKSNSLKQYLKSNLEQAGKLKIDSPWFVISIKKSPASVKIDNESLIPDVYLREIPASHVPDKLLIGASIKDGFVVPGAHLEQGSRIEIK